MEKEQEMEESYEAKVLALEETMKSNFTEQETKIAKNSDSIATVSQKAQALEQKDLEQKEKDKTLESAIGEQGRKVANNSEMIDSLSQGVSANAARVKGKVNRDIIYLVL